MLIVLLSWVYTFYITFSLGVFIRSVFFLQNPKDEPAPELSIFLGTAFLSAFLGYLSLFFKLSLISEGPLFALITVLNIATFQRFKVQFYKFCQAVAAGNTWIKGVKAILFITLLLLSLPVPSHIDAPFYHCQAIQWIEKYPVIPGLGNLFDRLAYNSSFFLVQAGFSFSGWAKQPVHTLNSFLILMYSLYLLNKIYESQRSRSPLLFFYLTMLLASFVMYRGWISSAPTDIPSAIFCWLICCIFINAHSKGIPDTNSFNIWLIWIFSVTVITFKMSGALIVLVPLYLLISNIKMLKVKRLTWLCVACTILVLPFIIRNCIISGYAIYPFYELDLFSFDWKIPKENAILERMAIKANGRIPGRASEVLALPFEKWIPIWAERLPFYNKILLGLVPFSFIVLVIRFGKPQKGETYVAWLAALLFTGIVYWFWNAPDVRFGYGYIIPFISLGAWSLLGRFNLFSWSGMVKVCLSGLCIYLLVFVIYVWKRDQIHVSSLLIYPAPYETVATTEVKIGKLDVKVVDIKYDCWDTPVPCVNDYLLWPDLTSRGNSMSEGFKRKGGLGKIKTIRY